MSPVPLPSACGCVLVCDWSGVGLPRTCPLVVGVAFLVWCWSDFFLYGQTLNLILKGVAVVQDQGNVSMLIYHNNHQFLPPIRRCT